jgi:dihydropteroate synthase
MGTLRQFRLLLDKLMVHQFGLPQIAQEIDEVLHAEASNPLAMRIGNRMFHFGETTYLVGILNVTPDSFSDGGKFLDGSKAIARAEELAAEGADIIDIGGESSRPGASPVSAEEEKKRVIPIIEKIAGKLNIPLSIDTAKAEVAEAALSSGAAMVNDISGLHFDPKMAGVIAKYKCPVCIMHIKGMPKSMQETPQYHDLMGEIITYLNEGLAIAKRAGILHEQIIVDPGIGFGKTLLHNLEILRSLKELRTFRCPILVGPSRKSLIGQVLNLPVEERLEGSVAVAVLAVVYGADFLRVHDVRQVKRAVKMADAAVRNGSLNLNPDYSCCFRSRQRLASG